MSAAGLPLKRGVARICNTSPAVLNNLYAGTRGSLRVAFFFGLQRGDFYGGLLRPLGGRCGGGAEERRLDRRPHGAESQAQVPRGRRCELASLARPCQEPHLEEEGFHY